MTVFFPGVKAPAVMPVAKSFEILRGFSPVARYEVARFLAGQNIRLTHVCMICLEAGECVEATVTEVETRDGLCADCHENVGANYSEFLTEREDLLDD